MKILLATNNKGKVERYKNLLPHTGINVEVFTPNDMSIEVIDIKETGETLEENSKLKVMAYSGLVDMPIIANDTGLFIDGEGLVTAPKREAILGKNEKDFSPEELTRALIDFWKSFASERGGKVDAAWIEAFSILHPDGRLITEHSKREIILTDTEFGEAHPELPVRCLYYAKSTGKPAVQHTEEDEILEMKPIIDALKKLLNDTN